MMTIKAPIELKVRSDYMHGYDAFGEKIAGNYALMGLEIGEEELLHMVSSPPEIYLADGGSTTIGGNTFISSRNEEKYSIVNNMLNRILLSVNGELTYQDRTYITDALHKLGIKDDRKFMTEVRKMIDESHLEETFLNNYFEMVLGDERRELREETLKLSRELAKKEIYHTERSSENFLSESILHRLQTGAIYQIVSNFNKSLNDTRIELQESMLSEQENVARKLLVQSFLTNIVKEEPELFHAEPGRTEAGEGPVQVIREIRSVSPERPGEILREEESRYYEQREREFRESEQQRLERESALRSEYETAEIIYREGEGKEQAGTPGTTEERVIIERTRGSEPGTVEQRITEQIITGQESTAHAAAGKEETSVPVFGERVISDERPGERVTERVTEESRRITERSDSDHSIESADHYITEREENFRTDREKAELVYREGENREAFEETILDRLSEQTVLDREQLRERQETERISTERIEGFVPGQEIRTDRVTSETIRQEERERRIPGETITENTSERVIREEEHFAEHTDTERSFEHTDRYVTEQGEILRTEHEGAEIFYRQEQAAGEVEEGAEQGAGGSVRETSVIERERYHEAGEPLVSEQRIQGTSAERVTETERREALQQSTEYRSTERLTAEREKVFRSELERLERLREAGRELTVEEERLRERLIEQLAPQQAAGRERAERDAVTERTERYVTEAGEVLRTEHEGAELIYREGELPESETGELQAPGTLRETTVTERERYREAGEPFISEQRIPGTPGERVTETERREALQQSTEYRSTERLTAERETVLRSELERIERLREAGRELTVEEERLRERLIEILAPQQAAGRDIFERKTAAERTERYVTETGEVLRTEHEGAELIYREGELPESEAGELQTPGTLRETRESERERISERERLEKERSSSVTREETFSDIRSELREKLESERIRTEQLRAGEAGGYGSAQGQAELIYREGTPAEERYPEEGAGSERIREILEKERERRSETERLEKERSSYIRETAESSVREEILEQLRTEQLRTERYKEGETPAPGRTYERSELIYRQPETAGEDAAAVPERNIREVERYRSDNVYERELLETERSRTEVTTGLAAAVLLDVVKTLFHAGYDRIGKGDSWIEYRGALYHSAENIFNRLNYDLEQRLDSAYNSYAEISSDLSLSHAAFEELQEITENAGDVQTIENTIREMNEMNLQNVDRYEQMVQVLKTLRPERKRTGGLERTRKEALSLLDDEKALYENLQHAEDAREEERREVFHEISRIFPENSVEIFKVVEQYLDGTVQPGKVGVTRNNVEAAAEEIRRITSAPAVVQEPLPEPAETESSELIYRRNDRMTQEELQEMFENIRRSENLQLREIEQKDQRYETDRRSTTTLMSNTERTLTRQDAEDIEALVSRGVRSQMSAISEQVLQKLEKKLKNEKIRRGI